MDAGGEALWRWQHAQAGTDPRATAIEPIAFSSIDGWDEDDHDGALECYARSLAAAGLAPFSEFDQAGGARLFFERNFVPNRLKAPPGLLTAYFEPVLFGSRQRSEAFAVPVYRRPDDLVLLPPGHPLIELGLTAGRKIGASYEPYDTRARIRTGSLAGKGLEIVYLSDAVQAFVMHVQGSGLVRLDTGAEMRLAFDGKNGHPYTSISKVLVGRGALTVEGAHLDGLLAWLGAARDPEAILDENASYIFFREAEAGAPTPCGSLGVPLTPGRSLAVDPSLHRLGSLLWVSAPTLAFEGKPMRRLMVAQDTGSAIRGPQRGDIFVGQGAEAGRIAGRVCHPCEFFVLLPKAS